MSKRMSAAPIWLGRACSKELFLSSRLAVVLNNFIVHLIDNYYNNLKYIQAKCNGYKHMEALNRKNDKSVQEIIFSRGGKLR